MRLGLPLYPAPPVRCSYTVYLALLLFTSPCFRQQINELLRPYEAIHLFMDAWLVLAVESPQVVYNWRLQAEQRMRELGRGALTDEQVCSCFCCGHSTNVGFE
jgi:pantothenate kinase-related protein Tda10